MNPAQHLFFRLRRAWSLSIRRQMAWSFSLLALFVLLLSGYALFSYQRHIQYELGTQRAQELATTLSYSSTSWVLANDVVGLQEVLKGATNSTDMQFALVLTPQGEVLASTAPQYIGKFFNDAISLHLLEQSAAATLLDDDQQIDVAVPVKTGNRLIGWVRVDMRRDKTNRNLRDIAAAGLIIIISLIAMISLIASRLARRMTSGLDRLSEVAHNAEQGALFERKDVARRDEIGVLARHLYRILDTINEEKQSKFESEARLRTILDSIDAYVYLKDRAGLYLFANRSVRELWNANIDDVVGYGDEKFFDAATAANIKRNDELVFSTGTTLKTDEVNTLPDNGKTFIYQSTKLPLKREDGSIYALCGLSFDVTQRERAEQDLQQQKKFSEDVINSLPGIFYMLDQQGNFVRVNNQFLEVTAYVAEDLAQLSVLELFDGDDKNLIAEKMQEVFTQGNASAEAELVAKSGKKTPYYFTGHLTVIAGTPYLVGIGTDITERRKVMDQLRLATSELGLANIQIEEERARLAERVEQRTAQLRYANHAKDSFLATMSHEIRTPLGGLLGMMELLGLTDLTTKQQDMLTAARGSGNSLLRIVNDILDWSKIEAGKLELAPHPAAIADLLNTVVSTYAQIASAKNIQIKFSIDPLLSHSYVFDPLRVSQILNNFTSNALKFTEHGTVEIRAQKSASFDADDEVCFSVKDSGVGIAPEQKMRLFQHYEQANAETARLYGGTGLGLAISRRLAELMGGTLAVESTQGEGSTFSLTLNLARVDLAQPSKLDTPPDIIPLAKNGQNIAVLIVDDHPLNRILLKQQLNLLNLQVTAVEDGAVALAAWQNHHFDLLITDCHMPVMDGYELTYRIREIERLAHRPRIPIIAWTANVLTEEAEHCQAAGMDDLLTKPAELAKLREKIQTWLVHSGVL